MDFTVPVGVSVYFPFNFLTSSTACFASGVAGSVVAAGFVPVFFSESPAGVVLFSGLGFTGGFSGQPVRAKVNTITDKKANRRIGYKNGLMD
jgi:hypothetical protein